MWQVNGSWTTTKEGKLKIFPFDSLLVNLCKIQPATQEFKG
jgi:hypothetical protein